jgi:acyl-CoA synthetase (AMP-forming)/AMP-acid ligase II
MTPLRRRHGTDEDETLTLKAPDFSKMTIPQVAQWAGERFGSASAVEEGDVRLSFAEVAERALDATRGFLAAGLEPGDRVAIWAPNIHEWMLGALGAQSAGGVVVPFSTRMKGAEAAYVLNRSRARILLTVGEFLGTDYVGMLRGQDLPALERIVALRGAEEGTESWSSFLSEGKATPRAEAEAALSAVRPDQLSDILFTSGTTGNPKGVMTEHGQNLRTMESWSRIVGLLEGDRYLIVNPFSHSFGYKAGWMSCLMRGSTILPEPVFDAAKVLARIGNERVTVIPGPPALYQSILANPDRAKYDLSSLRLAVTGAAPVPVELVNRMRGELGFEAVLTAYGLTEVCGLATICRSDDDAETISTTSGRAIEDVEVRCVDADGAEVARGEPGEIAVRGYNVMRGYFEDEDATRETIDADGWLHTGDVGVMDERGYVRITDRIKDMFIMGGFNCYPAEIENLLFNHPDIAQAAVIGVPDERMGEVGMAFVVAVPGSKPEPRSIIAWCRENMANYKVPRYVEVVDSLPMNASNKVTKFVLRERAVQLLG